MTIDLDAILQLTDQELDDAIQYADESWFWPEGGEKATTHDVLLDLQATRAEVERLTAIVEAVHDLHRTHTASLFTTQHDREAVAAVGSISPYQHRCRPHCREDRLRCRCGKTDCPTAAVLAD